MLYEILRVAAQLALRSYYSELIVQGKRHIPADGPLLVVTNHPNALVDALVVGTTMSRRVLITARATLFETRILASLLRRIGVIPLLRVQDVSSRGGVPGTLVRNDASLGLVTDALRQGEVILIFPEGISHDRPSMAPLKSGAARIALQAAGNGVRNLRILPIGLIYEQKERPASRILVNIGMPIDVDRWLAGNSTGAPALTRAIALQMKRVSLDFASGDRVLRQILLAQALSRLRVETLETRAGVLDDEGGTPHRIEIATERIGRAPPALQVRADLLISRLRDLEDELERRGLGLHDLIVSNDIWPGPPSALRELALAGVFLPVALLGRASLWPPRRAARELALYTLRSDPSRDQPAMRAILIGLVMVPICYVIEAVLISILANGSLAAAWLLLCLLGVSLDTLYGDRFQRVLRHLRSRLVSPRMGSSPDSIFLELRGLMQLAAELEDALGELSLQDDLE